MIKLLKIIIMKKDVIIMAKKNQRITLYRRVWCKIRYWQQLKEISDAKLASYLQVVKRTLHQNDTSAENVTLGRLDKLLYVTSIRLMRSRKAIVSIMDRSSAVIIERTL